MMSRALLCCCLLAIWPAAASAQQSAPPSVSAERIRRALERYRSEPSVDRVVESVFEVRMLDPGRAGEAIDRARWAGLLPATRAEVRRGQVLDLSALQGGTGDRNTWSTGDELAFSGSLTWQLDRLVFASEEPTLMRERRAIEERRLEVIAQVVRLYYERRRLQLECDLAGVTQVMNEVRILEIEALLDVLTEGAFSRLMAERGSPSPDPVIHDDEEGED